ncbi:hypothetical protein B0T20DRAFT_354949 [Sordaria brevicollis]|uniref:Uncharacterized protein n=1 Tax=Sordaria brevicollis TaxID=83679 RepID=A0AAE0UC53_SORBR|nr:hypothetical protein B0T20DRAFT_354949 [Sordaria brevicollis]
MAGNKGKTDGMRPKGSAKSTSAGVQNAPATEASRFLFKTATAPTAEAAPASTPKNPFILASDSTTKSANPTITPTSTTTTKKSPKKPLSKEEYLAQAERRYLASRARADADLRKVYRTRCPFAKRAVKRYAQRRSQWEASRRKLQKAGAFLEKTMGALSNPQGISASASRTPQKTSPKLSPEPSSAKPPALPQITFSADDHLERDTSKAPSVASSSDETVKSDTRTVDSLSTNITTPDFSDCDSLSKSTTKLTKQKTALSQIQTKTCTEQPTAKPGKFKITLNVETVAPSKEAKESAQKPKAGAPPTTSSGALAPKKSADQKEGKKDDAQELKNEKKSKKHKRDENDNEEGASTEDQQPNAKKPKISAEPPTCSGAAVMSPASGIDKSYKPYPNVPPEVRKELFIIKAEEMIFNPLGYDDLVYDDTRPKNKRPKWRKVGRNTGPSDLMMSGGIGPADGSTPVKSSKKKSRGDDDSLSRQVLKKGHNKRVAEEVASLKQKSSESFGEQKRSEFKKNKHGHHQGGGNNKTWKHNKPNNSASLAAKFRRHK